MAKTILSAGLALTEILTQSAEVSAITTDIFPGYTDEAEGSYISYRRKSLDETAVKTGRAAMKGTFEVMCFAQTYPESVALAEAVLSVLDGFSGTAAGMQVRGINLVDAAEEESGDAKCQVLDFTIRI